MESPYRPFKVRRSCRAVPASSDRFIEKVRGLEARGAVMLGPGAEQAEAEQAEAEQAEQAGNTADAPVTIRP
jgi:hypothetical protein